MEKTFENLPPVGVNCQKCGEIIAGSGRKYCGEINFSQPCATCQKNYKQKCQGRTNIYCSKYCQVNNPESIASANKKRIESGYLVENAKNTQKKIKEKYGVENISQLDWVKDKKKLAGPMGFARPEYNEIIKSKYGVDNISQLDFVKEKKRQKSIEKYGVDNVSKASEIIEKIRTTNLSKYGVETVLMLPENQLKSLNNNSIRISKTNRKWHESILKSTGVSFDFESKVGDNFLADLGYGNLRIDINPTISHSSSLSYPHAVGICKDNPCNKKTHACRERLYHQKRALKAEQSGVLLMQYFDWYDKDIFMSMVKSKLKMTERTIYGRNTVLKKISQSEANVFLKENHLLGAARGQSFCVGLFHEGELIHVQTYGKARMNKNYQWEAIRSASKIDTRIVGGFSKCDKFFFNEINPDSVVSYVDLATSQGDTEAMFDGWEFSHVSSPNAVWAKLMNTDNNSDSPMFIKDSSVRRLSADRMLGFEVGDKYPRIDNDGEKVSNDFVMMSEGYIKVYDCGTKVFGYNRTA